MSIKKFLADPANRAKFNASMAETYGPNAKIRRKLEYVGFAELFKEWIKDPENAKAFAEMWGPNAKLRFRGPIDDE